MVFVDDRSAALTKLDAATTQVKAAADSLTQALTAQGAARSAVAALTPDPVNPPPAPVVTPDGYATTVADKTGSVWSIVGGQLARNGTTNPVTSNVSKLYAKAGQVYFVNSAGQWYTPNPLGVGSSTPVVDPTGTAPPPTPSGSFPGPIAGWKRAFYDGFDTPVKAGQFPGNTAAKVGANSWSSYDQGPDTAQVGWWSKDTVTVGQTQASCLELNLKAAGSNGKPQCASPCPEFSSLYMRRTVKFKVAKAAAGWAVAWLLWPADDVWAHGEIDWPEGNIDSTIGGFIHDTSGNPGNNVVSASTGTRFADGNWHIATTEWTKTGVKFFLDDTLVTSLPGPANGVPTLPMRCTLQSETAYGQKPSGDALILIDDFAIDIPA